MEDGVRAPSSKVYAFGGRITPLYDYDALDALAVLWTAERIHRGEAVTLPGNPPRDAAGLVMEIVY